ncbi:hypothetical protein AQUCO_00201082v1 [Aquilegia coerulea]|uniref:Pre-mRNA-splicing factor Syf1/CRNKL1-like C-terminal HAT-repeats domain-containing protein n=1 Tax=Aquilegia coerulea TaxID=218851 RepID=A0A2G5F644_AQUCA|nr:hypothetical protein AQUCO_00201082v1 [Aquilegia coerulea]
MQISAEQLVGDARETNTMTPPPKQVVLDQTELENKGNVADARQVYEIWMMTVTPQQHSCLGYIKFELRYNEVKRAEQIYEKLVQCHPQAGSWIHYAKKCYERAVQKVRTDDKEAENLFVEFAKFEEESKEIERARDVYKFALNSIPSARAENLHKKFVKFEKQYGNKEVIEDSIVEKRRCQYEEEVRKNPLDYNTWSDYICLEETIANIPPTEEKQYWKRYIYLWINCALYEELVAKDIDRTRDVYRQCLKLIPHHKFSFAKMWLLAAQFEIWQQNLEGARKILGNSIGRAPKCKVFKNYIEIELQLGNVNHCRTLYGEYLRWAPQNCSAWIKFAQLEKSLSETQGARAIFELAVVQPALDTPELLWKEYINFEISEGEYERARQLYARLVFRTKHLNVWISYANFEATAGVDMLGDQVSLASLFEQKKQCLHHARRVFETAVNYFKTSVPEQKEERAMLLKEWLNMESSFGNLGDISLVQDNMPKKLKRRREAISKDGCTGYEECYEDYFPEETPDPNLKILKTAYMWKRQRFGQKNLND